MSIKILNVRAPKIDFPIKADCPICGELYIIDVGKAGSLPDGTRVMVCPRCAEKMDE